MLRRMRALALALIVPVIALASTAGAAQGAANVNLMPAGGYTLTSVGAQSFTTALGAGSCNAQLNGTISVPTIPIVPGAVPIADVSSATFTGCVVAGLPVAVTAQGLPWTITLDPTVGPVQLPPGATQPIGMQVFVRNVQIDVAGVCVYSGDVGLQINNTLAAANPVQLLTAVLNGGACGMGTLNAATYALTQVRQITLL